MSRGLVKRPHDPLTHFHLNVCSPAVFRECVGIPGPGVPVITPTVIKACMRPHHRSRTCHQLRSKAQEQGERCCQVSCRTIRTSSKLHSPYWTKCGLTDHE